MNMVVLIGRLVRDPSYSEVETEKGKYHIASFYLAVPRNFNKGVNYIKITTFGKQADFARDYLTKGKRVAILGELMIGSYKDKETDKTVYGLNYQKLGKQLMTEDEIAVMDGGKCILQIRGARPFFSDKYDITKHPNYKYLSDADPKNWFRPEIELNPQYVPKPEEEVEVTEIDFTQESE